MTQQPADQGLEEERFVVDANYVLFVFGVVILTIVNSLLLLFYGREERIAILVINSCLSLFLLGDAFNRLRKREYRAEFVKPGHGILIFLGSLPIPFFGIFRLIVTANVTRRLRSSELTQLRKIIVMERAQSTLLFVVLIAVVVYEIAVLMVLHFELPNPYSNIQSANDALWWGFVTISTVGYGDQVPVTTAGRITGVALIAVGVGLFTSITSFMANSFLRSRQRGGSRATQLADRDSSPIHLLQEIRDMVNDEDAKREQSIAELRSRIDELEAQIIHSDSRDA